MEETSPLANTTLLSSQITHAGGAPVNPPWALCSSSDTDDTITSEGQAVVGGIEDGQCTFEVNGKRVSGS